MSPQDKRESTRMLLDELESGWESPSADEEPEESEPPPSSVLDDASSPALADLDGGWDDDEESEPLPDARLDPVAYAAAKKAREERIAARRAKRKARALAERERRKSKQRSAQAKQKSKKKAPRGPAPPSPNVAKRERRQRLEEEREAVRRAGTPHDVAAGTPERSTRASHRRPPGLGRNTWVLVALGLMALAAVAYALYASRG